MKLPLMRRSPRRTTLLGVAALGVMLWAGVTQLGININELLAQFLLILAALLAIMVLAGLAALPLLWLRKRRGGLSQVAESVTDKSPPGDPASAEDN